MAAAVGLRGDFDAAGRCGRRRNGRRRAASASLAGARGDLRGATRTEASKIGGVGLQVVRDWVVKFNAQGPDGLIDRKAPGQPLRLNDAHRAALAAIVERDPSRRSMVSCAGGSSISANGFSRSSASRLRADAQPPAARARLSKAFRSSAPSCQAEGAIEDFKKASPPAWTRSGRRRASNLAYRGLVRRRGARRPEEQDHPALGQAWNAARRPKDQRTASAYIFGAICPKDGKGAGLVMPPCNTEAMNLHLAEIATQVAPGTHAVLLLDQAGWHLSGRLRCRPTSRSSRCPRNARS